jgi:hypothetical protein
MNGTRYQVDDYALVSMLREAGIPLASLGDTEA